MLNLSKSALEQLNKDKPSEMEVVASALAAAAQLVRMSPTDEEAKRGLDMAKVDMLRLLTGAP